MLPLIIDPWPDEQAGNNLGARDGSGRLVITENQLGPGDHGHFRPSRGIAGQVLSANPA